MTQKSMSINEVAVAAIGKDDHRIHFWFMTKSDTVDRMKSDAVDMRKKADLSERSGQL